jgi:hypothetical protein
MVQMQGGATKSMQADRRGATTQQMRRDARNPKGAWGARPLADIFTRSKLGRPEEPLISIAQAPGPRPVAKQRRSRTAFGFFIDWTYVSRRTAFVFAAVILGSAYLLYRSFGPGPSATKRAERAISAAADALAAVEGRSDSARLRTRLADAGRELVAARGALLSDRADEAIQHAIASRAISQKLLEGSTGWDATLVDAEGRVQVQKAGHTSWEGGTPGTKLWEGDFVKTGPSGSAEVMSADGTVFGIRSDTLFEVRRTRMSGEARPGSEVKVVAGGISAATGVTNSTIVTDTGTTKVGSKSRGTVEVDAAKETRVLLFDGSARVATSKGNVDLGARESVRVGSAGELRAERLKLPEPPRPLRPDDDAVFSGATASRIPIAWTKVPNALGYRFQIAKSRFFMPESILVDVPNRTKSEAAIAVNDEGSFFWRVASIGPRDVASEWSPYRRFRVSTEVDETTKPPALTLLTARVIGGDLVEVSGRTDPGAHVLVNGERAEPARDGAFQKIVTLRGGGAAIAVKATNGAGLATARSLTVPVRLE